MKIRLISSDEQLSKLCHETLSAFADKEWDFKTVAPADDPPPADLYIWDFNPELPTPSRLQLHEEQRNIFLVERSQLGCLRDRFPMAAVATLLKPVNTTALQAFLEHAVARYGAHRAQQYITRTDSLRADRNELLQCLLHANLKLQEYIQDRTNFLTRAVHDFRTPLTAVDGYCGLLIGQQLGPLNARQTEVLGRMQRSIKRLSRLAAGMFQLGVGAQVKAALDVQQADFEACIHQAVHEIAPFAEEKNIDISVDLEPPAERLYFEPAQMEQVLVNLLENACKFTPKNGAIEVLGHPIFWERRGRWIGEKGSNVERRRVSSQQANAFCVVIRDSGPGIPQEHLENIFEEYTSYSSGRDRSSGGLGLAICRMIITAHRGRIWAESDGGGACFSFVLPLGEPNILEPPGRESREKALAAAALAGMHQ